MTQKAALILSAVLTAFVLVVGGGVLARASQPEAAAVAATVAAPAAAPAVSAPVTDEVAQLQRVMQQRETQYRALIDQANERLTAMNRQLAAAQAAQAAPAPAASARSVTVARASQPAQPAFTLSAEAARNVAIDASNFATLIREPELVRFEGKVAYEVGFTRGVVYVDANTGVVLYNGTVGGAGGQPGLPGGEHETEPEHETESHD